MTKAIAIIPVNLEESPIATRTAWDHEICGNTILARTIERTRRAETVSELFIICPKPQQQKVMALAGEAPVQVLGFDGDFPGYRNLIRVGRKWSLDGWRGGAGGSGLMDEWTFAEIMSPVADRAQADAVVVIPGPAPLIDPGFIDGMMQRFFEYKEEARFFFAITPPGLSPFIFEANVLREIGEKHIPPSWTMTYKPDDPQWDLIEKKNNYRVPQATRHAMGRMIADTRRSTERIEQCIEELGDPDGEQVGQWLLDRRKTINTLPQEVEIELTTQDTLGSGANIRLRPHISPEQSRGPIDPEIPIRVARELAQWDDSNIVLGGFGDPILHPQFREITTGIREAGVNGIVVRTSGVDLTDEVINTLVECKVDMVLITFDAWTHELYRDLYGRDLQPVFENLQRLENARMQKNQIEPLGFGEMIKCTKNLHELEAFFDGHVRATGWSVITGFNHYGHRIDDYSVMDMSPPARDFCRRIFWRSMILADGSVSLCDQDFENRHPAGNLNDSTLEAIWTGEALTRLREQQLNQQHTNGPLCEHCCEWFRS